MKELKQKIVIDTINYAREKKAEQKIAILEDLNTLRKVHYRVNKRNYPKIELFEALQLFLNDNKPISVRINTLICSL